MSVRSIFSSIVECDESGSLTALEAAMKEGVLAQVIIDQAVIPALDKVGELFQKGEYFISEMLQSAYIVQLILKKLKPQQSFGQAEQKPKVVLGTVQGDLHDIGKNIVGMFLDGSGFDVIDLGYDVSSEKFIQTVKDQKPQIVGLSALLTTTMSAMKATVEALKASSSIGSTKIIVGGAPVTSEYARSIGADGFGKDAVDAVKVCRLLSGVK